MTRPDPLEHLLRLVEQMSPSGYLGPFVIPQMQSLARQVRRGQCPHPHTETANGVGRCLNCGQERLEAEMPAAALEWAKTQPCGAYQCSDQMLCACGLAWDVNDPEPPRCARAAR